MDKIATSNSMKRKGKKSWSKRVDHGDGTYDEIRVEEVDNGFIKCTTKHYKDSEGEWQWDETKTIHNENPMEEKSLADKLEAFIKQNS